MRSTILTASLVLLLGLFLFAQQQNPVYDSTYDTSENAELNPVVPNPPTMDNAGSGSQSSPVDSIFGPLHPPVEVITFQDDPYNHNMGIASDGEFYYTVNGGQTTQGRINVYDMQGNFISTNPIQLDMRGIVYNHNDGYFYVSTYNASSVYKILNVATGTFELLHSNILMNSQSSIGISWDGLRFYDHYNGTVNVRDFYSGALIETLYGFSYGPGNFGGNSTITADPDYLYTWNADIRMLYVYDMNGTFVISYTLPNGDCGMSLSFIDGNIFVANDGNYSIGTWFGYNIRDYQALNFSVTLTPSGTPIQIPANGGSFNFNVAVTNNESSTAMCQAWTMVTLPNGSEYGPLIGPIDINLLGGNSVNRDRTQAVPSAAPSGGYTYDAYVGYYPANIWDEDHFEFEKLAVDDGGNIVSDWQCWGAEFDNDETERNLVAPTDYTSVNVQPNPFNQSTVISYQLKEAGKINLSVYDILGQEIVTLVEGYQSAGTYDISFDGKQLVSGVYFIRLEAGGLNQVQKVILMK